MKPLLEVKNLTKAYGRQEVIDDISFQISEGQKIALIGRNGAGKSTLVKILTDAETQDNGEVNWMPIAHIGIINQTEELPSDKTTLEHLEAKSGKPSWECKKLAARFGLTENYLALPPTKLSGGYQMRVKLTVMLLKDPNILILDEPVNYLDLSTLLLLELFLKSYRGAFLLVAHDREFLNNTCDYTFEIERAKLMIYKGTVTNYLDWKKENIQTTLNTNKKIQKEIANDQRFVDRFKGTPTKVKQARSKEKKIIKLKRKIAKIDSALATTKIAIPQPEESKGFTVRTENLVIGYETKTVAAEIELSITRGEKILIAGNNGNGKSTLLKTLIEKIPKKSGEIKWWHKANIGYYDQLTENQLIPTETVEQYLDRHAPQGATYETILKMAGSFLFSGDDLAKPSSVLSGGERARLCLAGVLLNNHNTLILDEPTNHLDVETAEALAIALKNYKGTIIFVSHARTFVNEIADRILEIKDNRLKIFRGTYEEYVEDLLQEAKQEITTQKPKKQNDSAERRQLQTEIRQLTRNQKKLEKRIEELEQEKAEITLFFFNNPKDYNPKKSQRLSEIEKEKTKKEEAWLKTQSQVEIKQSML